MIINDKLHSLSVKTKIKEIHFYQFYRDIKNGGKKIFTGFSKVIYKNELYTSNHYVGKLEIRIVGREQEI